MDISIIIVNYNVKYYLEHCLKSIQAASHNIGTEVFIIDNASTDGSVPYLQALFPAYKFISNIGNIGFGKACNQGLAMATGKYILFLNPDTLIAEDTLTKCISFCEKNTHAAALGIKMLDSQGKFLKESKRSFPSLSTSFYKLTGLTALFPKSKKLARYYVGDIPDSQTYPADVLAGAFMFVKKEILDITGGFDEAFFMYGEDIDLSFRLQQVKNPATGTPYKNYYFAESTILHYKGESTKKGSLNYVVMFYNAMSIFVKKHYASGNANLFTSFINIGIWLRAAMTTFAQFIKKWGIPILDSAVIFILFYTLFYKWGSFTGTRLFGAKQLFTTGYLTFTGIFLISGWYLGFYEKKFHTTAKLKSIAIAIICLLAVYAIIPEEWKFPKTVAVAAAILTAPAVLLIRLLLVNLGILSKTYFSNNTANILIIGNKNSFNQVKSILASTQKEKRILGHINTDEFKTNGVINWEQLHNSLAPLSYKEIILCKNGNRFKDLINFLPFLKSNTSASFFIDDTDFIVGSDSKDVKGECIMEEMGYQLNQPSPQRLKRLTDVFFSFLSILLFPIPLLLINKPYQFFKNAINVLVGKKTWVGYSSKRVDYPSIRTGIIAPNGIPLSLTQPLPEDSLKTLDYWYAKEYEPFKDILLLLNNYRNLGN